MASSAPDHLRTPAHLKQALLRGNHTCGPKVDVAPVSLSWANESRLLHEPAGPGAQDALAHIICSALGVNVNQPGRQGLFITVKNSPLSGYIDQDGIFIIHGVPRNGTWGIGMKIGTLRGVPKGAQPHLAGPGGNPQQNTMRVGGWDRRPVFSSIRVSETTDMDDSEVGVRPMSGSTCSPRAGNSTPVRPEPVEGLLPVTLKRPGRAGRAASLTAFRSGSTIPVVIGA